MFQFKQFLVKQDRSAMKVTTDSCLFGAWAADRLSAGIKNQACRILDIGTGTGLLSLMVAQQLPGAEIDAVELDEQAFTQARENFNDSPWSSRLQAIRGDILEFQSEQQYDVIISNPPFYENEWNSEDPGRNMAHHAGGLKLGELSRVIAQKLIAGGLFYIILPFKRAQEAGKILSDVGLQMSSVMMVKQTPRHEYFRMMIEGSHHSPSNEISFDDLSIKDKNDHYTPEFIHLLKNYYLHL